MIPGTGLYNTLHIPDDQEGVHGLKPAQAHCSLQITFC